MCPFCGKPYDRHPLRTPLLVLGILLPIVLLVGAVLVAYTVNRGLDDVQESTRGGASAVEGSDRSRVVDIDKRLKDLEAAQERDSADLGQAIAKLGQNSDASSKSLGEMEQSLQEISENLGQQPGGTPPGTATTPP